MQWKYSGKWDTLKNYVCSERNGPVRIRILANHRNIFDFDGCDKEKTLQIYTVEVQWKEGHNEKLYICSERTGSIRMKMQTVKIGNNHGSDAMDSGMATIPIVNQHNLSVNIGGLATIIAKNFNKPE
jgi:hypothetical protein